MRYCEKCGSLMRTVPGGYLCSKCGNSFSLYANKYHTLKRREITRLITTAIQTFEKESIIILDNPKCMKFNDLIKRKLLKKKHYLYAILLAYMSSIPILAETCHYSKILKAILAKTYLIMAIKILDNLVDKWHTSTEAVKAIETQCSAFIDDSFILPTPDNKIEKADNSTYILADQARRILSTETRCNSRLIEVYKKDFEKYTRGQIDSIRQKEIEGEALGIKTFLVKVNQKAVGSLWFNVDACFLGESMVLTPKNLKTIFSIKRGVDLIFKGCNIYDDVADFEEDLKEGILNSVYFLAEDMGICNTNERNSTRKLVEKLKGQNVFEIAVRLGDLIFLQGIQGLTSINNSQVGIDLQALIHNAYVLRIFAMRKWLIRTKDFNQSIRIARIKIPRSLLKYTVYIR